MSSESIDGPVEVNRLADFADFPYGSHTGRWTSHRPGGHADAAARGTLAHQEAEAKLLGADFADIEARIAARRAELRQEREHRDAELEKWDQTIGRRALIATLWEWVFMVALATLVVFMALKWL